MVAVETTRIRVQRLTADGRPDPGFGEGGELRSPLAGRDARVNKAVVLPDGSAFYLLSEPVQESEDGWLLPSPNPGRVLRLDAEGRPDAKFASAGVLAFPVEHVPLSISAEVHDVASMPDGSLSVFVAYFPDYYECASEVRVFRFNALGAPDPAFGEAGSARFLDVCSWGVAAELIPLAGGNLYVSPMERILDHNGRSIDLPSSLQEWLRAMGETGLIAVGNAIYSTSLADLVDGKPRRFVIARWNDDLTLDRRFGPSREGHISVDVGAIPGFKEATEYHFPRLYPQATEPYLYISYPFVRTSNTPTGTLFGTALARLDQDGQLDRAFGESGFAFSGAYVYDMIGQPDGGVILGLDRNVIRLLASDTASPGVVHANLSCDRPYADRLEESGASRSVRLSRHLGDSGEVAVDFRLLGISASIPDDLDASTAVAGTLSWKDGETDTRSFALTVRDDALPEGNETFDVEFSPKTGNPVLLCSRTRFMIPSNDLQSSAPVPPVSPVVPTTPAGGDSTGGGGALGWGVLASLGALSCIRRRRPSGKSTQQLRQSMHSLMPGQNRSRNL